MKLDKIKLSGFKSFADQTTIIINGNLTAVVGPNGCGKSNVIDAVRWVMGESSAKHLRGGNMADVIFNGSSGRKPVSVASVELIFDNQQGKAGGEYANYSSISIKRQVSRDGLSQYYLNGSKCRRKDITDLFLGTGLGARSYAIIEQGTISRMVESKPEELRLHIEEAAGISKYKERRHETETRMRHTRENMERLDDLRDEVEKQLTHLKKQAEKAEKYTTLKKQERRFQRELLALRWNGYQLQVQELESSLQVNAGRYNQYFEQVHDAEKGIEEKREQQKQFQYDLDQLQEKYYQLVAETSRLEQAIQHNELNHQETENEIQRLKQQSVQTESEINRETERLSEISQQFEESEEKVYEVRDLLETTLLQKEELSEMKADWQQNWEDYLSLYASQKEKLEVETVNQSHIQNRQTDMQQRRDKLQQEREQLANQDLETEIEQLDQHIEMIETDREDLQLQLEQIYQQIIENRQQLKQQQDQLHTDRSELHQINGKISSLQLLQQHAMGKDNEDLKPWLEQLGLMENKRLAEFIEVEPGWETAVENVLGHYLEAICLDDLSQVIDELNALPDQSVTFIENQNSSVANQADKHPLLIEKLKSEWNFASLLSGVYCCESLSDALAMRAELFDHETLVTQSGDWVGKSWLQINKDRDSKSGVLQREKELRQFKRRHDVLDEKIEILEQQNHSLEQSLKDAEIQREDLQQKDKILGSEYSTKSAQFSAYSTRQEQQQQRLNQISQEVEDLIQSLNQLSAESVNKSSQIKIAETRLEDLAEKKQQLMLQNETLQNDIHGIDLRVNEYQTVMHTTQGQIESLRASESLIAKQIERMREQSQEYSQRLGELEFKLTSTLMPLDDEKKQLQLLQQEKQQQEQVIKRQREQQQMLEKSITDQAEQLVQMQRAMQAEKDRLDQLRYEQQESTVRQQTLSEQLAEIEANPQDVLSEIESDANEAEWKAKLDGYQRKIESLGSINLTAIEEFQSQSERMNFLNEQKDDLLEALNTLEQAINKIDKESRQRFKETFDKINQGLQNKFPRLFGGGQAYLELTEQNLLEAGVNIIARPPGKKNSSIHLLSGGEKALTAVALVFSIFDLNPAPFCLLDEVDAPLDDANVVRFSKMVEEMSENVQFLYISHNKVTMEIAKQLTGVTMKEPGVSRMVSVDIDEAIEMAEADG